MLDLFNEEGAWIKVFPGVITPRIVAVVVEYVKGNVFLWEKVEKPCVQIKFTVEIECINILDRDWDAWGIFSLQIDGIIFPAESAGLGDVVVTRHIWKDLR